MGKVGRRITILATIVAVIGAIVPILVMAQAHRQPPSRPELPRIRDVNWVEVADRNERDYHFHGIVRGRVTYEDGSPAVGATVSAGFMMHMTGAQGEGAAITDSAGRYEIRGLGPEDFFISVLTQGSGYLATPKQRVSMKDYTPVSGIDFVLQLGPEVNVKVTDAETGMPVKGLAVRTMSMGMGGPPDGHTDANGEYRGRVGYLEFDIQLGEQNNGRGYGAAPGSSFYHHVKLAKVAPVEWEALAYDDPYSHRPAVFRGEVVDELGQPVADATIRYNRYGDTKTYSTDSKGRFEIDTFRVLPYEDGKNTVVLKVEKDGEVTTKLPTAAETWNRIHIVMRHGETGTLTGQVVDDSGRPIPNCPVTYWEAFPGSGASVQPSNPGLTDSDGRFRIEHLSSEGVYQLMFGETGSSPNHLGATYYPAALEKGQYVRVEKGETKGLGTIVVPRANGKLSGTIVDTAGKPLSKNISVVIKGEHGYQYPEIDAQGHFSLDSLVDEPLMLRIFASDGHFTRTSDDSPDLLLARPVKSGDLNLRLVVKWRQPKP